MYSTNFSKVWDTGAGVVDPVFAFVLPTTCTVLLYRGLYKADDPADTSDGPFLGDEGGRRQGRRRCRICCRRRAHLLAIFWDADVLGAVLFFVSPCMVW